MEEVADEPLGALIQVLEVGRELNSGVSAEMKEWSDADLRCDIGGKVISYPRRGRSGGGAPEDPSPTHLLLGICSGEREEARVLGA